MSCFLLHTGSHACRVGLRSHSARAMQENVVDDNLFFSFRPYTTPAQVIGPLVQLVECVSPTWHAQGD